MAIEEEPREPDAFDPDGGRYQVAPENQPLADQITALLDGWDRDATGDIINLLMNRFLYPERWASGAGEH